ncbi:MAG: JDVT-CTERM domain-containing protein, partial [Granulosicoccaceae bacterium]
SGGKAHRGARGGQHTCPPVGYDHHDPDSDNNGWLDDVLQLSPVDHDSNGIDDYLQADYVQKPTGGSGLTGDGGDDTDQAIAGVDGYGGCSFNPGSPFDPSLWLILLLSWGYLRKRASRE